MKENFPDTIEDHDAWIPANLTCKGEPSKAGFICPDPEHCKGDILFGSKHAYVDQDRIDGIMQGRGNGKINHLSPEAGGAL